MAILHDIGESLTFDISKAYLGYLGRRGEEIKRELGDSAWATIVKGLKNPKLAREYSNLQSEYDANETRESKIVHAADGLDILLQVVDYRQRGYSESSLADLWRGTMTSLKRYRNPSTRKLLKAITRENRGVRRTKIR